MFRVSQKKPVFRPKRNVQKSAYFQRPAVFHHLFDSPGFRHNWGYWLNLSKLAESVKSVGVGGFDLQGCCPTSLLLWMKDDSGTD